MIAEIGVNHDGEVARALELTRAAAEAGADAVKLQYFETDRLLSKAAKLATYQKAAGETDPVAMLRRLELSLDEMANVVDLAHELGIHAIVTVFSVELVKPASELAWDAYKSASPDSVNDPLIEALATAGKPLIMSTGASTIDELEQRLFGLLIGQLPNFIPLHCVSSYPTRPEDANIGGMYEFLERYQFLTSPKGVPSACGYSDHTAEIDTGALAVRLGASMLEKHFTYDQGAQGPDHAASLTVPQFAEYVRLAKDAEAPEVYDHLVTMGRWWWKSTRTERRFRLSREQALAIAETDVRYGPLKKTVLDCERNVREVARQSLATTRDIGPGETLTRNHLTIKRPGTGLEPFRLDEVIGKRLARSVEADTPLVEDDLA